MREGGGEGIVCGGGGVYMCECMHPVCLYIYIYIYIYMHVCKHRSTFDHGCQRSNLRELHRL